MAETSEKPKKNKAVIIIVVVIALLLIIGGIYLFSKATPASKTTVAKETDNKGGLTSLLGSLNLSGLNIF